MVIETLMFELTTEQTHQYLTWLKNESALHAQENEKLDQVTISFTFTR
jgi:hypothetical protein